MDLGNIPEGVQVGATWAVVLGLLKLVWEGGSYLYRHRTQESASKYKARADHDVSSGEQFLRRLREVEDANRDLRIEVRQLQADNLTKDRRIMELEAKVAELMQTHQ